MGQQARPQQSGRPVSGPPPPRVRPAAAALPAAAVPPAAVLRAAALRAAGAGPAAAAAPAPGPRHPQPPTRPQHAAPAGRWSSTPSRSSTAGTQCGQQVPQHSQQQQYAPPPQGQNRHYVTPPLPPAGEQGDEQPGGTGGGATASGEGRTRTPAVDRDRSGACATTRGPALARVDPWSPCSPACRDPAGPTTAGAACCPTRSSPRSRRRPCRSPRCWRWAWRWSSCRRWTPPAACRSPAARLAARLLVLARAAASAPTGGPLAWLRCCSPSGWPGGSPGRRAAVVTPGR